MDSQKLVKQAQKGDPQAFGGLYDEFSPRIFGYIRRKISDQRQAEDILQEIFLKVWQALPKTKTHELNFPAWLFKIASNTINDYFRKSYRSPLSLELDENAANVKSPDSPAGDAIKKQDTAVLKDALTKLSPKYREILELRFIQEFSIKETCEILDKNSLSVRVGQYRALQKLRKILENSYDFGYEKIQ